MCDLISVLCSVEHRRIYFHFTHESSFYLLLVEKVSVFLNKIFLDLMFFVVEHIILITIKNHFIIFIGDYRPDRSSEFRHFRIFFSLRLIIL